MSEGYQARVYPNGEFAVWRPKKLKQSEVTPTGIVDRNDALADLVELNLAMGGRGLMDVYDRIDELAQDSTLGLSIHANFDKPPSKRYGLNGITSSGRRKVRNGCYLLERAFGCDCLSFFTGTVPVVSMEVLEVIHQNWSRVVDGFKRLLTRKLSSLGLSEAVVIITEIQEGRFERYGVPVLHIHAVFQGRKKFATWGLKVSDFDDIWSKSLSNAAGQHIPAGNSCNVQRVRKSAQGYLGKYMSKGVAVVESVKKAGYEDWLPRQWWGMTRRLSDEIGRRTRTMRGDAESLWLACSEKNVVIAKWSNNILLEMDEGEFCVVAYYGLLSDEIRDILIDLSGIKTSLY